MKTEVTMVRFLDKFEIRQKSKSGLFNLTDMLKVINRKRALEGASVTNLGNYFNAKPTIEFLEALAEQKDIAADDLVVANKKGGTWAHPYVLMDFALWGYPALKVRVYDWIFDNLLGIRNDSGDTYKEMNIVLDRIFNIKGRYWIYADVASQVAKEIGVGEDKNRWQIATERQLKKREQLHKEIMASALYGKHKNIRACVAAAIEVFRSYK